MNPGAIDRVTREDDGFVAVHLEQTWEWDGSDHQLLLLQEKLFNYLAFVADGELARTLPGQLSRWGVVVDCRSEPDARVHELLRAAASQFAKLGGGLVIRPPSSENR